MKRLGKKKENQKGFSLVELIIVIAILGIIAAIAVPNVMGALNDARKQTDVTNARSIANTVSIFRAQEKMGTVDSGLSNTGVIATREVDQEILDQLNLPNANTKFDPSIQLQYAVSDKGVITVTAGAPKTGSDEGKNELYPEVGSDWK